MFSKRDCWSLGPGGENNAGDEQPEHPHSRCAFQPDKAKALWDKLEFVYTPKHGSRLNMAEIELNVITGQCLNRRISDIEVVRKEVRAWQESRNNKNVKVNWQFTTENARIKLSRLYPTLVS